MIGNLIGAGLALGAAVGATALWLPAAGPSADEAAVAALLDPANAARATCSLRSPRARSFRPPVQLAARAGWVERRDDAPPPLWDGLGSESFPVTTRDPLAQRYFDQGLRLAFAFNHGEAVRAFRAAERIDPECAMCYWGEAYVLGPNINDGMYARAVAPAHAAAQKAASLAPGATEKERALIAAVVARYGPDAAAPRRPLDEAYAEAMGRAARRFPDDPTVGVLYAEALMDLQPWDYWAADRATPRGRTAEILATLERILAVRPDYAAAIHLYIHMVEASTTPERAEPYADRLGALMPAAGHLVHMPSHIYYRVGRYVDSLEASRKAAAADEAYLARGPAPDIYASGYYPHNIHFVMVSAQMAGAAEAALAMTERLKGTVADEVAHTVPWVQAILAAPYFAHAQFSRPETVLALRDPGNGLPYVQAMWRYARAMAHVARHDLSAARDEAVAIARTRRTVDFSAEVAGALPVPQLLELAERLVAARLHQAKGALGAAEGELRRAVALQDGLAYMEPPYWYYPVRQTLGAVLLAAGRAGEAVQVLRRSLIDAPNNGWALWGLREALKADGDEAGARAVDALFRRAWAGDESRLSLGVL